MNLMPNCCRKCGEEMKPVPSADVFTFFSPQQFCSNAECEFAGVVINMFIPTAEGGKQTQDLERL